MTCVPKFGMGSWLAFDILSIVGGIAILGACVSLAFAASREWAYNNGIRLFACLMALASFCLLNAGLLGWPFRAAVRMHDGEGDLAKKWRQSRLLVCDGRARR